MGKSPEPVWVDAIWRQIREKPFRVSELISNGAVFYPNRSSNLRGVGFNIAHLFPRHPPQSIQGMSDLLETFEVVKGVARRKKISLLRICGKSFGDPDYLGRWRNSHDYTHLGIGVVSERKDPTSRDVDRIFNAYDIILRELGRYNGPL